MASENLFDFFKSVIEQDDASVVICSLEHKIIYMNKSACSNYAKWGGKSLEGKSILDCHNEDSRAKIKAVTEWFLKSKENNKIHTFYNLKQNKDVYMVALRDGNGNLIGYYEKHEFRTKDESPFYLMK